MRDTYQDLLLPELIEKGFKDTDQTWNEIIDDFKDKVILDVGCNQGYFMVRCLQAGAKKVIGVDLNGTHWCTPIGEMDKPLDVARKSFEAWDFHDYELIEGNWEDVVIKEKIDIILCLSTSHYFKKLDKGLRNMFALKPELLIFEANPFVFSPLRSISKEFGYRIVEEKNSHWNGYTIFKFKI